MALIELTDVDLTYRATPPVSVLRRCSVSVDAGDYVALVGPSGSGKSTLLNVMGLLERPTGGRHCFDGAEMTGASERERASLRAARIGFVFQSFHLLPARTALANVELAAVVQQTERALRRPLATQALERVGLGHRLHARASTLSGGERQRVALARAFSGDPDLVLCDEPTGNLDSTATGEILDLLDERHRAGTTLVVVTHDAEVADRAARVIELVDGAVVARAGLS